MNEGVFKRDIQALLREEAIRLAGDELREGDITYKSIAEDNGITIDQAMRVARKVLDPLVASGDYVKIRCRNPNGGGPVATYRLAVKKKA